MSTITIIPLDQTPGAAPRARRARPLLGAAPLALLLTVAACGSADGPEADGSTTQPPPPAPGVESATAPGTWPTAGAGAAATQSSLGPTSRVEPRRLDPQVTIALEAPPANGIVTEDAVWVATENETLLRIDPATNEIVHEISAPGLTYTFDIGLGAAWIPDFEANLVRRVDLTSGAVVAEIGTGESPEGVAVTDDAVWVADHRGGTVTRIDPSNNHVAATIEVGPAGPAGPQHLVSDGDRVWVGVPNAEEVVAIDVTTNQVVERVRSAMPCGPMEVIAGDLWVTSCFEDDVVDVIDTARPLRRGSVDAGGAVGSVLDVDGVVWLSAIELEPGSPGALVGVDRYTGRITDRVTVADSAYTAATGFDSLWMFSWESQAVVRLPLP